MVVLIDGVEYWHTRPATEEILEDAVRTNYRHIFGITSLYFDVKRKLRSRAGVASIPDGYAILFDPRPKWYIVEVELASHPVYDHVVSQLTKFNRAVENTSQRREIVEFLYGAITDDPVVVAQVKQRIKSGEIYKFVSDVVSADPIIVIIIDEQTDELAEALKDIRGDKKVVEFETYQRVGVSDPVRAYVFDPVTGVRPDRNDAILGARSGIVHSEVKRRSMPPRVGSFVGKKPLQFHLLGQTLPVVNWQDILLDVCDMVQKRHPERFESVLLGMRSPRCPCFSKDKRDLMDGQGLLIRGTNIYAATKLNADAMVARCRQVIREFGYNPQELQIDTRDR